MENALKRKNEKINSYNSLNNCDRWNKMFQFKTIEKGWKKEHFSGSISTNDVDASVIYDIPVKTNHQKEKNKSSVKHDIYYGLNPGKKATIAGVKRTINPDPRNCENIKDTSIYMKSKTLRWQMGEFKRRNLKKIQCRYAGGIQNIQ